MVLGGHLLLQISELAHEVSELSLHATDFSREVRVGRVLLSLVFSLFIILVENIGFLEVVLHFDGLTGNVLVFRAVRVGVLVVLELVDSGALSIGNLLSFKGVGLLSGHLRLMNSSLGLVLLLSSFVDLSSSLHLSLGSVSTLHSDLGLVLLTSSGGFSLESSSLGSARGRSMLLMERFSTGSSGNLGVRRLSFKVNVRVLFNDSILGSFGGLLDLLHFPLLGFDGFLLEDLLELDLGASFVVLGFLNQVLGLFSFDFRVSVLQFMVGPLHHNMSGFNLLFGLVLLLLGMDGEFVGNHGFSAFGLVNLMH
mmetsp:Transcript_21105/g.32719  ORF Transcript_21105/g.32719 Transcript_21105/m.32719 type:complete len:310 (-) Transcript_21105:887-1816(-)